MDVESPSNDPDGKVTVEELISAPFSTRSLADREKIVKAGRPVARWDSSKLPVFPEIKKDQGSVFEVFHWLTTSDTTCKFYCWNCLLFRPPGVVFETGITLYSRLKEHDRSPAHMESTFYIRLFASRIPKVEVVETANFEALKRLTDVVCGLVALQRIPESDVCSEILAFLRTYDVTDKSRSDEAIKLLKDRPDVVGGIVEAVAKVARLNVARSVRSSRYVSLILDRHPQKVSWILRYVSNGKVKERFLGFSHASGSTSVCEQAKTLMDELDVGSKCIALSLDGGLMDPSDRDGLFAELRKHAPHCKFAPCHSHSVDSVWRQSLSAVDPRCKRFFQCLRAAEAHFRDSPDLCAALNEFAPETGLLDVSSFTDFLSRVHWNRLQLVQFFDEVVSDGTRWDAEHVSRSVGCREILRDQTNAFLLQVFCRLSALASPLRKALASYVPERRFEERLSHALVGELRSMRGRGCVSLLADNDLSEEEEDTCIRLFGIILDRAIAEVEARYHHLELYHFCCLFDFLEEGWYGRAPKYLSDFDKRYHLKIDRLRALSELAVLEKHGAFSKTSAYDFHQHLHDSNLKHTFESLFAFSELVLTMPFKRPSLESEASVRDEISKWSAGPECGDSHFLLVETDYLLEMMKAPYFYHEVCAVLRT